MEPPLLKFVRYKANSLAHALILTLLLCWANAACAIIMGPVKVYSFLDEPLVAEIELSDYAGIDLDQLIAKLGSAQDFTRAGLDRPYFLNNISFSIISYKSRGYIYMRSIKPVQEPYLEFLIELSWPDGSLIKDYTLLIDPPPPNLSKEQRPKSMGQLAEIEAEQRSFGGNAVEEQIAEQNLMTKGTTVLTPQKTKQTSFSPESVNIVGEGGDAQVELVPSVVPDVTQDEEVMQPLASKANPPKSQAKTETKTEAKPAVPEAAAKNPELTAVTPAPAATTTAPTAPAATTPTTPTTTAPSAPAPTTPPPTKPIAPSVTQPPKQPAPIVPVVPPAPPAVSTTPVAPAQAPATTPTSAAPTAPTAAAPAAATPEQPAAPAHEEEEAINFHEVLPTPPPAQPKPTTGTATAPVQPAVPATAAPTAPTAANVAPVVAPAPPVKAEEGSGFVLPLIIGLVLIVVIVAAGLTIKNVIMRRRARAKDHPDVYAWEAAEEVEEVELAPPPTAPAAQPAPAMQVTATTVPTAPPPPAPAMPEPAPAAVVPPTPSPAPVTPEPTPPVPPVPTSTAVDESVFSALDNLELNPQELDAAEAELANLDIKPLADNRPNLFPAPDNNFKFDLDSSLKLVGDDNGNGDAKIEKNPNIESLNHKTPSDRDPAIDMKIKLAKQYMDSGDRESAKVLLQEALDVARDVQRVEIQMILSNLT